MGLAVFMNHLYGDYIYPSNASHHPLPFTKESIKDSWKVLLSLPLSSLYPYPPFPLPPYPSPLITIPLHDDDDDPHIPQTNNIHLI